MMNMTMMIVVVILKIENFSSLTAAAGDVYLWKFMRQFFLIVETINTILLLNTAAYFSNVCTSEARSIS